MDGPLIVGGGGVNATLLFLYRGQPLLFRHPSSPDLLRGRSVSPLPAPSESTPFVRLPSPWCDFNQISKITTLGVADPDHQVAENLHWVARGAHAGAGDKTILLKHVSFSHTPPFPEKSQTASRVWFPCYLNKL